MDDVKFLQNTTFISDNVKSTFLIYCQRQLLAICPQNINSPENHTVELTETSVKRESHTTCGKQNKVIAAL